MLFNIANVAHARPGHRRSGGSLMMYRSAHGAAPLLELPDSDVERAFLDDLYGSSRRRAGTCARRSS